MTVFTSTSIVATLNDSLLIVFRLAGDAQAHPRDGFTAGLRDSNVALLTLRQAFPARQLVAGTFDRILDGCINLLLNCTVFRKTALAVALLQ